MRDEHDTPFKGPPPSEPLRLGGHCVRERRVGSLVAQRLADGIETPGGEVYKHIYWTDGRVPIQPRQCLIEITYRQLHLFSRGVMRSQSRATFQPVPAWRQSLGVATRSNDASSFTRILRECRPEDELRPRQTNRSATAATTVATISGSLGPPTANTKRNLTC